MKKGFSRRQFIQTVSITAAAISGMGVGRPNAGSGFKLKYAPHFGMFKHHAGEDLIDQLKFMTEEGFTAIEDNGIKP